MGNRSVIYGHIRASSNECFQANSEAILQFQFDEIYPFKSIFYLEEPSQYKAPSIIIGGTFKQIEEDWPQWLSKFVEFLGCLEAVEVNIILDCWFGRFAWTFNPEVIANGHSMADYPTLVGQGWMITSFPENEERFEYHTGINLKTACAVTRVESSQSRPHN